MATNKMEMKEIAKNKTLWKMNSVSEPLLVTGVEVNPLKKFTIPKIRRTAEKVYLSPCCTNTREYSFIHDTLNQCQLDVDCDLQSSWQFGDTKLVHNEDLEKNFTSKRSEMRESGRHGRELEEHFCFLALSQNDVAEIYQNGISTRTSTLKILGNPLLGTYMFRHVDVALNYAHSRSTTVESIIIFKVLFGKVKKIQPSVCKNKVSLDPSPNFDCHMSRSVPSLKDTIELQAYNSAVYFYEYNVLSKPVDKPRQCLPYAIVTVKFIGQKIDNGHLITSLRFLSSGFPKRAERTCSLNNCTVAKRIGKGKDATVIFEHFRKPVDPFVPENCSCSVLNAEINPSNANISNTYGNVQNGNISIHETYNGQKEHNLAECRDTSQVHICDSSLSFIPSGTRESVNGDLMLNLTHFTNVLSGLSAAFPLRNNTGSSTVITSKLIKDPRLMRREESIEKHNNIAGLNEILPLEKSLDFVNSGINLSSMPSNSASSSEIVAGDHSVLTSCLDTPCFKISLDNSQSQAHNLDFQSYNYTTPNKMAGQCKGQDNFSSPMCLPNIVSEVENQKHSEGEVQRSQQRSNIPLLIEEKDEPHNSYESVNTCIRGYSTHISQKSWSSNSETVCQTGQQMSTVFPLQRKENIDGYIQNIEKMRDFTDPEDNSRHGEKQILWKETEAKISPIDNYISLYQECKGDESHDSFGKNSDQILITQELEIPKSSTSATKDKYKLDHLALELQSNLTPRTETLSQKHPQPSLEYEDNIHTSFAVSQKLMELKLEKPNENCVSIMTNAFQEAKDIPQAKELPIDGVISSHDVKTTHDNSNCSVSREHIYVHRKNENDRMSLENMQRDCKVTFQIADKGQSHTLSCNAELHNDIHLNIDFKEQGDHDKENENETKEENTALSTENNRVDICGHEKQGSHTNKNYANIDERKENKNYNNVEILSSEEFCTFNLTGGEKCISTEATFLDSENTVTAIKQKDTQNTGRSVEHLTSITFPQIAESSVHVASNAAVQIAGSMVPTLGTNHEDHQRYQIKEACSSESLDFGLLVKHKVSDCEMDIDDNQLHESFHQSISDSSVLQSFEVENKIEVGSEQCNDAFLIQQDPPSHGNVLYEEFRASFEALKSRIDWEGLLGSNNGEREVLKSSKRRENNDQRYSEKSNCLYSSIQKNKAELCHPILLPDLQVRITNIFLPGFSPTSESLALKDKFCKNITKTTEPEINKEGKVPGFEMYSQCSGENSGYSLEDEFGNTRQESGLVSKSEISHSLDVNHNTQGNHASEKQNSGPLLSEPSNVTTLNNESRYSLTKSKTNCNDTRSKKDTESKISKRKPRVPFKDENMAHKDLRNHEIYGKRRRLTSQDSFECFSSLSQGRIKTFSKSEKHIKSVLDILNTEASLCKSKRLSRKLDRAVLHLKKAHRRVHTSLQLIAKVGEKRKGPLPKSYAIICNNFWESCDLQGYSSVSERRYYSTKHFLSKRKYDKPREKRALGFEMDKSLTPVSKHKSYQASRERITECLSNTNVASSVSSHTTVHVREFCDQEYPESQLTLCSTPQSTSWSTYNKSSMRSLRSSELQTFSGKTGCLFSPPCPDEKLTKKENQIGIKFLSNMSKYEKPGSHSANHKIKDTMKESHSETNKIDMKDVTKVDKEKTTFKHPRTTRSHPESESEIGPSSSDNLKRHHVSPKKVEVERSLPGSVLPLKNLKDICTSKSEGKIYVTNTSPDTSEDFTGQQGNLNSMKKSNVNFSATETSDKKDCSSFAICEQRSVDGRIFPKDCRMPSQRFLTPAEKSCPSDIKPGTDASPLPDASVLSNPIFHFIGDIPANLGMNDDTVFELQDNEILNSSIKNSACTNATEPKLTQNKSPILHVNKTQPAKTELKEKYMKDTLSPSTIPVEASENLTLNVNQTAEYSFSEQQNNENSKVLTQNAAAYWNELPRSACTPIYNSSEHSFGTSYPYHAWCVYHYSSSGSSSLTQTYRGITSYEVQAPPSGMLTAIASTVQNTHPNLLYSQYFGYFAGEPQANNFVPVDGYFQSQVPVSYNFQQPIFSQYAPHQPFQQAVYPYPPDSGVLPEAPWTYVPCQQEPFQPGH
ncbi:testis-expressed protein 15 isoform X3 [Canis lupus baileyi]|uniref:testis-expressed protein 15 isoform X3 n=1 Tax=Canis lupus baileyi TaxID=143281 RepID=UPI003B97B942